jgi:alpha,alpha-trehalose phosphorylase
MFSFPDVAKSILLYRYSTLDKARKNAALMNHKGAMFPWRTINGDECSAYFPAGAAQYHITGNIAYAIKRYYECTGDHDFMCRYGSEVLMETARFWLSIGHFNERLGGQFCIDCVTGPDEYTALVNNNCYTNVIAAENMLFAAEVYAMLKEQFPDYWLTLKNKLKIEETEPDSWIKAGKRIYLPFDELLGIYKQDDSFLDKKRWDFDNTPKEHYPLLMHYHPLVIYRHQVSKQPDLLLIEFLAKHRFDIQQIKRDYDYYSKVITHDSSLSESVFAIIACMVGDYEKAYQFFMDTVRLDLDNTHGNTKDGLHMANLAGAWGAVIYGFAGLKIESGIMRFTPILPPDWDSYRFKLQFNGRLIAVLISKQGTVFNLLEGEPLEIVCNDEIRLLQRKD